jgi:exoribonuclease-2
MHVFFEEDGEFRAGTVMTEQTASLHVELPHGKRVKVKVANVLLRFEQPPPGELVTRAQVAAQAIDTDFLWQCCGPDEFGFEALGRDYYGHAPDALESAALLLKLRGAPMYFYKRGNGRYKAAPAAALKAALASTEKKRAQAAQKQCYLQDFKASRLPEAFRPLVDQLLYAPDKTSLEWKALETACDELRLTPPQLFARCGALASPHDYHLNRFLFEYFSGGTGFGDMPPLEILAGLPRAEVAAFSIDDAATTEIDDAFSVTPLPSGGTRIGIHIAAPALGIPPGSILDAAARRRLSTVYFPGAKITMLPETAIAAFTLAAGSACPALSLYADVTAAGTLTAVHSRCEYVPIAANLRTVELERVFNAETLAVGTITHEFGAALKQLWRIANRLADARSKAEPEGEPRREYNFHIEEGCVRIVERERGTPLDKVVSELMIYANGEWGRQLAEAGYAALYRAQSGGVAYMTVEPAPHQGLGVPHYTWASSPLRRYADLVNQRQLLALFAGVPAPYQADAALSELTRAFELTYDAYAGFQHQMERYWCLRWLEQEHVTSAAGTVIRDNLVRLDELPLVVRVFGLCGAAAGAAVRVTLSKIDLWKLTLHADLEMKTAAG